MPTKRMEWKINEATPEFNRHFRKKDATLVALQKENSALHGNLKFDAINRHQIFPKRRSN